MKKQILQISKLMYLVLMLNQLFSFNLTAQTSNKIEGSSMALDKEISVSFSAEELELYHLINAYRVSKGLPEIALSVSLSYVAQQHALDLRDNEPNKRRRCNLHSWSKNGPWTACCYTDDHKKASCVWQKPAELTNYKGTGYEIAYWISTGENVPVEALKAWKKSKGHNHTMMNKRIWKKHQWKAIGVGIVDGYAMVWFGVETDPEPKPILE